MKRQTLRHGQSTNNRTTHISPDLRKAQSDIANSIISKYCKDVQIKLVFNYFKISCLFSVKDISLPC